MASVYKVLGQSAPTAASLTTLYTVPASTSAIVSSITVCNTSTVATSFRIAVRVAGASITAKQYLYYDLPIGGKDTFIATVGLTLATTDIISVYATLATLSFQAFGQENS